MQYRYQIIVTLTGTCTPLPPVAGLGREERTKVAERSDAGEGHARGKTLIVGPLFAAQPLRSPTSPASSGRGVRFTVSLILL